MKKKTLIIIAAVVGFLAALCAVWAVIHRRAIAAAVRNEPYPECPHWLPGCLRGKFPPAGSGE